MKKLLTAISLLFSLSYAHAYTGNDLLSHLNGESWQNTAGMLYIRGVTDAHPAVCPPDGVTVGQVRDIVHAFLKENPKVRHLDAVRIVVYVTSTNFPCAKEPSKPQNQTY